MNSYYTPLTTPMGREQALKNIIDQAQKELSVIQSQQYTPGLTQNFQITPMQTGLPFKIVNSIDDINKELVITDTYFILSDFTRFYIKNSRGDLRIFNLIEDKPKDEKDLIIEDLKKQIDELKGGMYDANNANAFSNATRATETERPENVRYSSNGISKKGGSKGSV